MTVYIFPGQGIQKKGMGKSLFNNNKELLDAIDPILGYSIKQLCLEDPKQLLNQTQFAQPAIYVVNALHYLKKLKEHPIKPDYVAGHSLGEYNALLTGEAFDFLTGLKLVQQRALLMGKATDGLMIAVLGLSYDQLNNILDEQQCFDVCIANYNSPSQFVLSGKHSAIERMRELLETIGQTVCIPIKTSGPFHSPFMAGCKKEFEQFLEQFEFNEPCLPVISNVTAKPYRLMELKKLLTNQITEPVLWTKSMQYLLAKGQQSFEEIGESTILTNLIRTIKEGTKRRQDNKHDSLPASQYSKIFWLSAECLPAEEQCRYHLYGQYHYKEAIDTTRLETALQRLVNTNYNLRSTFTIRDKQLTQVITKEQCIDLHCEWVNNESQYQSVRDAYINQHFDLAKGPLFRFVLIINKESKISTFIPIFHHIIIDGTQFDNLLKLIGEYYNQPINLELSDSINLKLHEEYLKTEHDLHIKADPDYWTNKLKNYPLQINLPKKYASTETHFKENRLLCPLEQRLYQRLKLFSKASGHSVFQILKTVWAILISEYSNQKQLVISFPMNTRGKKYQSLKGAFVNTLYYCFTREGTFRQYLKQQKEEIRARAHWYTSTYDIFTSLQQQEYDFSVAFSQSELLINGPQLSSIPHYTFSVGLTGAKLYCLYQEMEDSIAYGLVGLAEWFDDDFLEQMHQHFDHILTQVLENPDIDLNRLSCLSKQEYNKIIHHWNETAHKTSLNLTLLDLFAKQAQESPHALAVSDEHQSLTYKQLNERSTVLATYLSHKSVNEHSKIAVCINRSVDLTVCLLAVMKASAAYVPLDPAYPEERLSFMIQDSGCSIVLSHSTLNNKLTFLAQHPHIERINIDADLPSLEPIFTRAIKPNHLAYVIYTSGSTGQPKGVMVTHRGLANLLIFMREQLKVSAKDKLLAITTYCFDIAALELFLPLIAGAQCHICSSEQVVNSELLKQQITTQKPTLMQATPSTWARLLQSGWRQDQPMTILCGGEALPERIKEQLLATECSVWNVYGPTETTIWSTMQPLNYQNPVTLGKPIANTQIYVLNKAYAPCPIGVAGDLYISGAGVARGYHNNSLLTNERFIPNPWVPGEVMYQTGDCAQWLANGELAYLGRSDQQVKIRGFRIELGDIEQKLNQNPDITQAIVLVEEQEHRKRLIAYYLPKKNTNIDLRQWRSALKQVLPDYMIPHEFVEVTQFPLTPNGKIDKKCLIKRETKPLAQQKPIDYDQLILTVFKNILNVTHIELEDHFFDIGGDSFTAVSVIEHINRQYHCSIPVTELFRYPRIKDFSTYLKTRMPATELPFENKLKSLPRELARDELNNNDIPKYYEDSIAIIGISCQFNGIDNHDQFWELLKNGETNIQWLDETTIESNELITKHLDNPQYVAISTSLADKDKFDPTFFNISPRDAELMDPQGRLLLMHAWSAVEDAGYLADDLVQTSVFMSTSSNFYQALLPHFVEHMTKERLMNNTDNYVAWLLAQSGSIPTMISNKLGFKGPSLSVNTNCSSSLVGLQLACQNLLSGDTRQALVGAATLFPAKSLGYVHQPGLNFSSDGRCKTFDKSADGMVGGEGVAVILIKKAMDAIHDGDSIYALIRGVAVNNDGADKVGFYAPSIQGQTQVIQKVLDQTQINPESICYVEAHGTGTKIGDPIEFNALSEAYRDYTSKQNFCGIGSVKTNIGHLDTAAGFAGLIKTALLLKYQAIPQSLHYKNPNSDLNISNSPFYVVSSYTELPISAEPYRAAISAFGIGGTNAHAILEHYQERRLFTPTNEPVLIVLSTKTQDCLKVYAQALLAFLERHPHEDLGAVAHTLQVGRKALSCRIAFIAADHDSACRMLRDYLTYGQLPSIEQGSSLQDKARRWLNGEAINWRQNASSKVERRISLPTYPFTKKRYWIDVSKPTVHPIQKSTHRSTSLICLLTELDLQKTIIQYLATTLKLTHDEIQLNEPFADYGLDSLVGVNLVHQLNNSLKITLHVTSLFDYPTVTLLTQYILTEFEAELKTEPTQPHHRNSELAKNSLSNNEPIAIIGMSARYPKADDVHELWEHLSQGTDLIEPVTRWNLEDYDVECTEGGFLKDISTFDPLFFSISGLEASYMEPQQRIFLEESWKALEDAGYVGQSNPPLKTGVYVGCCTGDYLNLIDNNYPAQAFWGNMSSLVPARLSYYLNLQGPAVAVDTACSSSLVAIHQACQSLRNQEIDMAVTGGVFVQCSPRLYVAAHRARMLSPKGRCQTFDDKADGFVPSEGAGVLILKRLSDALKDGDSIHAVIRGSGINQDGTTNGITAPSANSQERLERQVYESFGINPSHIQLVEAHGTGTKLGDPIEFQALSKAFATYTDKRQFCALGSIKSNIGHTQLAAGVVGIIKIILALKHQQIPPSLHYQTTNTNINLEQSPFYINTSLISWPAKAGHKRMAATSSFGASGTNAHFVIEEAPERISQFSSPEKKHLIVLSAHSEQQLRQQAQQLLSYCQRHQSVNLGDVSFTLLMGRKHLPCRGAWIAQIPTDLINALFSWLNEENRSLPFEPSLSMLAEEYLRGKQIDAKHLFKNSSYQRISLPTYPFAKESYWLPNTPAIKLVKKDFYSPDKIVQLRPLWEEYKERSYSNYPKQDGATVIIGGSVNEQDALRKEFPHALPLDIEGHSSPEFIQQKLAATHTIVHLIWIAPTRPHEATSFITGQNKGVLFVFRILKALLALNYSQRALHWTLITHNTQKIAEEHPNATDASIHGLVGTIAKEYPNWLIRLADVDTLTDSTLTSLMSLAPHKDGNALIYRQGTWYIQKLSIISPTTKPSRFRKGGVYVIIGGAGGIGEAISAYLIREYKAQIIWIGRQLHNKAIELKMNQWRELGPKPYYISADASDLIALQQAYAEIKIRFGLTQGVIQAALVFDRCSLDTMKETTLTRVLQAKVNVSVHMQQVFDHSALDFMLFISSINSYLTALGQGHYAAACAFKDAFGVQISHEAAYPVRVINLGYCFNNMSENTELERAKYIQPKELMAAIESLLAGNESQMALMNDSHDFNNRGLAIINNNGASQPNNGLLAEVRKKMHAVNELLLENAQ